MQVVCIADLHGNHNQMILPQGDMLIIAGDLTVFGNIQQLVYFSVWLEQVAPNYPAGVILIAGNHDTMFDYRKQPQLCLYAEQMFQEIPNVHYLNDSGITITFDNRDWKVWGSPITPEFCGWAFNRERGPDIKAHWDLIPDDVNILVTHGPPKGYRDSGLGCQDLLNAVESKTELKLHVFGHIHPPYGCSKINDIAFVNAAQCLIVNDKYVLSHTPIVRKL